MNFKKLLEDDDAVSPVIGVILMVAITVILAAVIGTFVLGLGDQVQETAPNAQFSFDFQDDAGGGELHIGHDGGQTVPADNLVILHSGGTRFTAESSTGGTSDFFAASGSDVSAGNTAILDADGSAGGSVDLTQDVEVLWESDDGSRSSTLADWSPN